MDLDERKQALIAMTTKIREAVLEFNKTVGGDPQSEQFAAKLQTLLTKGPHGLLQEMQQGPATGFAIPDNPSVRITSELSDEEKARHGIPGGHHARAIELTRPDLPEVIDTFRTAMRLSPETKANIERDASQDIQSTLEHIYAAGFYTGFDDGVEMTCEAAHAVTGGAFPKTPQFDESVSGQGIQQSSTRRIRQEDLRA